MSRFNQIPGQTAEDFTDELATGIVYKYSNSVMKPLRDKLSQSDNDSVLNEALEGALSTFQFATMNTVIQVVQEYVMVKLFATAGTIFAYIKGSSVASKLKNKTQEVLTTFGKYGGAVGKFVKGSLGVVLGTQEERLTMAKMANDNVNNLTNIVSNERQNQILMKSSRRKSFENVLSSSQRNKITNDDKKINMFLHKMKSGTWKNTAQDKYLYEQATAFDFSSSHLMFNKSFVDKLNQLSEYAKDVEGNMINLAQTHVDYVTTLGYTKV
ncbi:MAG: hypothetical protein ACQERD_00980 [Campylobacterota bacterium]